LTKEPLACGGRMSCPPSSASWPVVRWLQGDPLHQRSPEFSSRRCRHLVGPVMEHGIFEGQESGCLGLGLRLLLQDLCVAQKTAPSLEQDLLRWFLRVSIGLLGISHWTAPWICSWNWPSHAETSSQRLRSPRGWRCLAWSDERQVPVVGVFAQVQEPRRTSCTV